VIGSMTNLMFASIGLAYTSVFLQLDVGNCIAAEAQRVPTLIREAKGKTLRPCRNLFCIMPMSNT
jgi:hypothetical protein